MYWTGRAADFMEARTADSEVVQAEVVRNMLLWEDGRREEPLVDGPRPASAA